MKKKILITVTAVALVLCFVVGGTLAWLVDKTDPVVNTFTYGDINIELKETTTNYKMVPGEDIAKDPKVTVKAKSEDCWLFVKVEKSEKYDTFLTHAIAEGWIPLEDEVGVYYREVTNSTSDQSFAVLKDNKVTVNETVTKEMLTASDFTNPTLTFTAYAIQKASFDTAAAAWAEINK